MKQSLDILIFAAHPDDAEIGMGATIFKHTSAGYKVGVCDLTCAELSSNGTVAIRAQEATQAAAELGLSARTNLGLPDRGLAVTPDQMECIALEIRKFKPRIVFAPYWQDRHPDHVICSQLVQAAVFNAKLPKYLPEHEVCQVEQLLFYFINDIADANILVDVSTCYRHKLAALQAYKSQFLTDDSTQNHVPTPLNQGYLQRVEMRDRLLGMKHMIAYAEGFVSMQPVQIDFF